MACGTSWIPGSACSPGRPAEWHVRTSGELDAALAALTRTRRMVFVAGLPGVGKSLLIRELARAAGGEGRSVQLLQWDVARPAFETPALLRRYPEVNGVTHAVIRKAVGLWARGAVARWHAAHPDPRDLLIGEVPIVGNRLLELVQAIPDDAEPLLAGEGALFVVPVPTGAVRATIEAARAQTFASPTHAREAADAPPGVLRLLWHEVQALAARIGAAAPAAADAPYDPRAYAAVYRRLLRHRRAVALWIDVRLAPGGSVYALAAGPDVMPVRAEADAIVERIERGGDLAAIERQVADWFDQV